MMDTLKRIIKELWCKWTTGHQYRAYKLKCHVGPERVSYHNECVCCGKISTWAIPLSALRADYRGTPSTPAPIIMPTQFIDRGRYICTPVGPAPTKPAETEVVEV